MSIDVDDIFSGYTHQIELPEDFQETSKKLVRRMHKDFNTAISTKIVKCSEFGSMQTKTITDQLFGLSNTLIGVVDKETDTRSLSLTLIKKRTSSNNGQKPQILMLKNGQKFLSQLDSLNLNGTKDEEGSPVLRHEDR